MYIIRHTLMRKKGIKVRVVLVMKFGLRQSSSRNIESKGMTSEAIHLRFIVGEIGMIKGTFG